MSPVNLQRAVPRREATCLKPSAQDTAEYSPGYSLTVLYEFLRHLEILIWFSEIPLRTQVAKSWCAEGAFPDSHSFGNTGDRISSLDHARQALWHYAKDILRSPLFIYLKI